MSALVLPAQQETVQGWFKKLEYGCQYTTWRLFYQDAYNKWKAENTITQPGITLKQEIGNANVNTKPGEQVNQGNKPEGNSGKPGQIGAAGEPSPKEDKSKVTQTEALTEPKPDSNKNTEAK